MQAADFASFFRAVHGHPPFPWQQRLVEQLAGGDCWPDVLDLPTGAGKTAALDAAVFHLALRANTPRRAALRIVLVVDRRLVVDDAYRRAQRIACALHDPSRCPEAGRAVVEEVRRLLLRFAGDDGPPLEVARLRGGAPLEHDWARTPTQPTILCSTVDQVGSRLLFRGYGVSDRMRPVHAGLLGEDTLILLDEAHLSEPFRQTLHNVRTIGGAQVRTVVLTATPGEQPERPLQLQPEDYRDRTLRGRVEAAKPVRLMKPIRSSDPAPAFARAARDMADRLRRDGVPAPAVGVVVNRVDLARAVFEKLNESESNCLLMIGRSRAVDRDRIVSVLTPYRTGSDRAETGPLMVVATQCLEVGVDLDLDGMVTQAASLDALRQRFGRLNRAGRDIAAEGAILVTAESLAKRFDDPVYGDRIRKTWDALTSIAGKRGQVDFGFQALDQSLQAAKLDVDELAAERARAPVLMPAYLDLWSQTSPVPAADPDVGLFLHGSERVAPEVSIAWRGDITADDLAAESGAARLEAILELMPPRSVEMVEVPIWAAEAWLRRWNTASAARIADVAERENDLEVELSETNRRAFRWAGANDLRTGLVNAGGLRAGDVLVVPADYGGCDSFGWAPRSREYVRDVADEAAWPYRGRRHAVRITPEVAHWDRLAAALAGSDELDLDGLLAAIPAAADDAVPDAKPKRDVRKGLEALLQTRGGVSRITVHRPYEPARGVILVAPRGIDGVLRGGQPVTESDALSHAASGPVPLDEHTDGVVEFVERFADTLKLAPSVAADLRLAACLHDEGKADERFQLLLAGGDWWNRPDGPVLAKSGRPTSRAAWHRAELPKGWRHEALSVQMATADPRFRDAQDPLLVLWLIGTHHGFGRPFFGFSDPRAEGTGPQSLAYSFEGLDWASVFDRLRQRYGTWGLARLEAILRLADHRASEAEKP